MVKKITIATIVILIIYMLFGIPLTNNYIAYNITKNLKSIELPPDTSLVETVSAAGKLVGNGNGMQYFGAMLLKSDLSVVELMEFYKGKNSESYQYTVETQKDSNIQTIDHGNISFSEISDEDTSNRYYIVYAWGESSFFLRDFDLRAH